VLLGVTAVVLVANNFRADARTVELPPVGQVSADAVEGSPVFVVHREDDTIYVLDAVSPHASFPKVLAWCKSAGVFEDLWHGSMFDPTGRWITGPAPTDMARYEVLGHSSDRLTVGERQPATDRPQMARAFELEGPRCDVRTDMYGLSSTGVDPAVLNDLVVHRDTDKFADDLWFPTRDRVLGHAASSP